MGDQEARENKMSRLEERLMSPIFGYNVANSWTSSNLGKDQKEQDGGGMLGSSKPPGWSGESNKGSTYIPQDRSWLLCLGNYHEKHNYTREITNAWSSCVPWDVPGEEWYVLIRTQKRSHLPGSVGYGWNRSLKPCRLVATGVLKMSPRLQMMP